ncbi:MAG: hypothetical protein AUI64_00730 [Acidobacteria bacterium 13_1_40CM_2_64_6]|nr:MAG: hypothetical protein AUH72_10245 [Acidobacteria bacterium 13_1_40CM_4_65_8]OLD57288.1 MAG: hypothetical protein AUI64_00730 [Acidobacteria bacterium 13_1_40CM_2_64_6]
MGDVRIGTSGWNYPSGKGTWNGVFYPKPRPKGFDELAFYAEHFDTVEVNSTFYGQPRVDVSRAWAKRTPPGFEFSVKLYQKFTHPRMAEERLRRSVPEARERSARGSSEREGASEASGGGAPRENKNDDLVPILVRPNQTDLDEFRRGIEPLASSGKLGALLAQFPASFKDTPASRESLAELLRALGDYPVAVELRHKSWSDQIGETLTLLNGFGAAWVQIDEPKFRFSIRQNYLPNVQGFYYMRLHGRNVEKWWRHDKAEDRYDYLYSSEELKEFSETAGAAKRLVKKLYLYTNNHFSAKSVANAAMIKQQLGEPIDGEYPPEFLERYPELKGAVKVRSSLLRA